MHRSLASILLPISLAACGDGGEPPSIEAANAQGTTPSEEPTESPASKLETELSENLTAWSEALDAVQAARGDYVAGGTEKTIAVLQALVNRAEASRQQLPTGTPARVELPRVERVDPEFRADVASTLKLVDSEPAAVLSTLTERTAALEEAMGRIIESARTRSEEIEDWGAAPAVFNRDIRPELVDRQYVALANYVRGRIGELRRSRLAALEAEKLVEMLSARVDASADELLQSGEDSSKPLTSARVEYAAATSAGDVEVLAAAANSAANRLHSKRQASAVWAANATVLEGYERELQAAIDSRQETRTIAGLWVDDPSAPREEAEVTWKWVDAVESLAPSTEAVTGAQALEEAQDRWRTLASAAALDLAAFELTDGELEVRDPYVEMARAEIARIRPDLAKARARIAELQTTTDEARSKLAEAQTAYRRAVTAERVYRAWRRASSNAGETRD